MVIKDAFRILDPVVEPASTSVKLAPRLKTLDGAVVGLYSNEKTNATKILGMVGQILSERFHIKDFVRSEFNMGGRVGEELRLCDVAVLAIGD